MEQQSEAKAAGKVFYSSVPGVVFYTSKGRGIALHPVGVELTNADEIKELEAACNLPGGSQYFMTQEQKEMRERLNSNYGNSLQEAAQANAVAGVLTAADLEQRDAKIKELLAKNAVKTVNPTPVR